MTSTTSVSTGTNMEQQAYQLLKASSWFSSDDVSEDLLRRLASALRPFHAKPGHIFCEEGQPLTQILVLEQGTLLRTKYAAHHALEDASLATQLRAFSSETDSDTSAQLDFILENSIIVDKLTTPGRISGLLHSIKPGGTSFATIVAAAPETVVWTLAADDFRNILRESPEYTMELMACMARELQSGKKSLKGLMEAMQQQSSNDHSADENNTKTKTCKVLVYDATTWTTDGFTDAVKVFNQEQQGKLSIDMDFTNERLSEKTATFAAGYDAVCLFVNDTASADVLKTLSRVGVQMIALRCAGFDRVDTKAAKAYGLTVARVPAYSPYAVAEMAVALLMTVNRRIHHASNRVKMANFTLDAGLMGMDIHGKTVGIMGTGKIGQIMCDIMLGFGVKLLCYDVYEQPSIQEKGGVYVTQQEIYQQSDILMLAMPLIPATHHTINMDVLDQLKPGVIIINTSRGGLVDTKALLKGLQTGVIGGVGMDVYENEQEYFFQDWSAKHMADQDLIALLGNNNVVLTAHQAFFTKEAVNQIVQTTLANLKDFSEGKTGQDHPNNCLPLEK